MGTERNNGLRHKAFFDELDRLGKRSGLWHPTSPSEWHIASAGLLLLRVLDRIQQDAQPRETAPSLGSIRDILEHVARTDALRQCLIEACSAIAPVVSGDALPRQTLARALHGCAHGLAQRGQFAMAVDMATAALELDRNERDADLVWRLYRTRGSALRMLGDFEGANADYLTALDVAQSDHLIEGIACARYGLLILIDKRGNLPRAEREARTMIEELESIGRPDLASMGYIVLGDVLQQLGRHEEQFRAMSRAAAVPYAGIGTETEANVAQALFCLGRLEEAQMRYRSALANLHGYSAWICTLNLLEIAAMRHDRSEFQRLRGALETLPLPAQAQIWFALESGRGFATFGESDLAEHWLRVALQRAEEYPFGRTRFQCEEALSAFQRERRRAASATIEPPAEMSIAWTNTVREMV